MITMARKVALAAIAVFLTGRAQLIAVGLVITVALVAHMTAGPYVPRDSMY
jgi:hypothetical protein